MIAAQAIELLHRRPGRKRIPLRRLEATRDKQAVEPAHVVVAIAKAARIRHGASEANALSDLQGTVIGRLFLRWQGNRSDPGSISDSQYHASQTYLRLVQDNARVLGIPSPHPRAMDLASGSRGKSCGRDVPPDVATEIKGRFRDARRTLLDTGASLGRGSHINRIVYNVVILDQGCDKDDIRDLRCGLNALARLFEQRK